jgi:hypothetical protein
VRLLITALVSMSYLGGCSQLPPIPPKQPNVASLDPQDWYIFHSSFTPPHPSADPNGAWSLSIPNLPGHVNYIQTPFNTTIVLHNVTITFKIESDAPQYIVMDTTDHLPATVHLFFEQRNDDLRDPNGRWWATWSKYDLGSQDNTTITFVIPLTPDQWSNVYGKQDATAFYVALANIGWIGVTCGGQYFWGHGVAMRTGTAKYILVDLSVN